MDINPDDSPDSVLNDFIEIGAESNPRPSLVRKAEAEQRALRSYELRITEGLTWKQIGEQLGITATSARQCYDRARIILIPKQDVEVAKEIALEKLDMWEQMALDIYNRKHKLVVMGKLIEGGEDFAPRLQALDRLLKIETMRQKIVGYLAPSKRVLEVVSEDSFDKAIAELNAQAAELERQAAKQTEELAEEILGAAIDDAKLLGNDG